MDRPKRSLHTERSPGVTTTWYLVVGPRGAAQFLLLAAPKNDLLVPLDFGVHSVVPLYDGHESMGDCPYVPSGLLCFYSGSTRMAKELLARFQEHEDPEIIWLSLEQAYSVL